MATAHTNARIGKQVMPNIEEVRRGEHCRAHAHQKALHAFANSAEGCEVQGDGRITLMRLRQSVDQLILSGRWKRAPARGKPDSRRASGRGAPDLAFLLVITWKAWSRTPLPWRARLSHRRCPSLTWKRPKAHAWKLGRGGQVDSARRGRTYLLKIDGATHLGVAPWRVPRANCPTRDKGEMPVPLREQGSPRGGGEVRDRPSYSWELLPH